jgi:hypothetical protein
VNAPNWSNRRKGRKLHHVHLPDPKLPALSGGRGECVPAVVEAYICVQVRTTRSIQSKQRRRRTERPSAVHVLLEFCCKAREESVNDEH